MANYIDQLLADLDPLQGTPDREAPVPVESGRTNVISNIQQSLNRRKADALEAQALLLESENLTDVGKLQGDRPLSVSEMLSARSEYGHSGSRVQREKHSLWEQLQWLDLPANVVRSGIASWAHGEGLLRGMQEGGLKGENLARLGETLLSPLPYFQLRAPNREETSGRDMVNALYARANPEGFRRWQLNAIAMDHAPELIGHRLMTGDDDEVFNYLSPLGDAGIVAGALTDVFVDPLAYFGALEKGVARGAGAVARIGERSASSTGKLAGKVFGKVAELADPEVRAFVIGKERYIARAAHQDILDRLRITRDTVEGKILWAPDWMAARQAQLEPTARKIADQMGKDAERLDLLKAEAGDFLGQVKDANEVRSRLDKFMPSMAKKLDELRAKGASKTVIDFGSQMWRAARKRFDEATGTADKVLGELDRVTKVQESIATKLDEGARMRGEIGSLMQQDPVLSTAVAREIEAIQQNARELAGTGVSPVKAALRAGEDSTYSGAGVRWLEKAMNKEADRLLDLAHQGIPYLDGRVMSFSRDTLTGIMATRRANDMFFRIGRLFTEGGVAGQRRAAALKKVYEGLLDQGHAPAMADKLAFGTMDGLEAMDHLAALVDDHRYLAKMPFKPSPELLRSFSDDMAQLAGSSQLVMRQLEGMISAAKKGVTKWDGSGLFKSVEEAEAKLADFRNLVKEWHSSNRTQIITAADTVFDRRFGAARFFMNTPLFMGLRDPERVFRGTGIYDLLRDRTQQMRETLDRYTQRWASEVHDGLSTEHRNALGRALDGRLATVGKSARASMTEDALDLANREALARIDPELSVRFDRARAIFDDMADTFELPRERRISNYFPHLLERDSTFAQALREGRIPDEHAYDWRTLRYLQSNAGMDYKASSQLKRLNKLTADDMVMDATEAFRIYATQMSKATFLRPAFDEAADILRTMVGEGARSGRMLDYLKDLERVVYGLPTRADNRVLDIAQAAFDRIGRGDLASFSNASKVSMALTLNTYRATIGLMLPTWLNNITQVVAHGSQHGTLSALQPWARIFLKHDPVEIALHGRAAARAAKGTEEVALSREMIPRLLQDHEDLFRPGSITSEIRGEAGTVRRVVRTGIEGNARGFLGDLRDLYDRALFSGMKWTERWNRGLSFHAGLTEALRDNMNEFDAIRYGQQIAEESQFIFGAFGRAPAFNGIVGRPLIGQFTTFPSKMLALQGKMALENPSAFLRYVSTMGYASNLLSRADLDPSVVLPLGFMPNRYALLSGYTPIARLLLSGVKFASGGYDADSAEGQKILQDFTEAAAMVLVPYLPVNFMSRIHQSWHMLRDHEIRDRQDMYRSVSKAIPFLRSVYEGDEPDVLAVAPDDRAAWMWATGKIFGLGPRVEPYVQKYRKEMNEVAAEQEKLKRDVTSIMKNRVPEAWDEADREKIQTYVDQYGYSGMSDIRERIDKTMQTVMDRRMSSVDRVTRRRMALVASRMPPELAPMVHPLVNTWDALQDEP